MKKHSSPSTTTQPINQQANAFFGISSPSSSLVPAADGHTMSWAALRDIVLPLPAFLATNSHKKLINPIAIAEGKDPYRATGTVRVCYQIAPDVFCQETSLEQALVALLRASRRGDTTHQWPLRITAELIYNAECRPSGIWSALVISASRDVELEHCVGYVVGLLQTIVRSGYVRPLDTCERALLGRPPLPNHH